MAVFFLDLIFIIYFVDVLQRNKKVKKLYSWTNVVNHSLDVLVKHYWMQGIYVPKSLSPTANYICKRSVWVPLSLSHECLAQHLESFGATLPFSIQKVMSLHRIGLCGVNPTRTVMQLINVSSFLQRFQINTLLCMGLWRLEDHNMMVLCP